MTFGCLGTFIKYLDKCVDQRFLTHILPLTRLGRIYKVLLLVV